MQLICVHLGFQCPLPRGGGGCVYSDKWYNILLSNERKDCIMQLTLSERKCIESGLNSSNSLRTIARQVDRPVSTVSREIRRNAQPDLSVPYGRMKNKCIHRRECSKTGVCSQDCHRKCAACHLCNANCPDFCEEKCPVLAAPLYVCNGCSELKKCALSKMVYRASSADKSYRTRLV